MKTITLAGGCFWGAQKYLAGIHGVQSTQVGYANGATQNPTYEQVCTQTTGHAEAVQLSYDESQLPLPFLLDIFYDAIDPTSKNRQGGDTGPQYRTGIYYTDPADRMVIDASLMNLAKRLGAPVAVECEQLACFWPAEEYHQDYLDKNPGGYCHISPAKMARAAARRVPHGPYTAPPAATLQKTLTPMQYSVTQQNGTEPPFENEYWNTRAPGIYVDVTTGQPLFASSAKFDSGCGWPSFSRPIDPELLQQLDDDTAGMRRISAEPIRRTEVRSRAGNAHLGHVFPDGPTESGGLRYCINSAALRFVPKEKMADEGYAYLLDLAE